MSTTNYVLPTLDRTPQIACPPESCSPVFYDLGLAPITWTFLLLFALCGLAAANVHQKDFLRVPEQLHRAPQYNYSMMGYLKLWVRAELVPSHLWSVLQSKLLRFALGLLNSANNRFSQRCWAKKLTHSKVVSATDKHCQASAITQIESSARTQG